MKSIMASSPLNASHLDDVDTASAVRMRPEMTVPHSESSGFFILFPPLGYYDRECPAAILAKYPRSRQRRARGFAVRVLRISDGTGLRHDVIFHHWDTGARRPAGNSLHYDVGNATSGPLRSVQIGFEEQRMRCSFNLILPALRLPDRLCAHAATGLSVERVGHRAQAARRGSGFARKPGAGASDFDLAAAAAGSDATPPTAACATGRAWG